MIASQAAYDWQVATNLRLDPSQTQLPTIAMPYQLQPGQSVPSQTVVILFAILIIFLHSAKEVV